MRRGRPRHDDILTPREWQVLDLLREGLTNDQIAGRLGFSPDTAKFHVSEILSKLNVSSRQEAAAWQGQPRRVPVAGLPEAVTRIAGSTSPLKVAGVATIVLAATALGALTAGVLLSDSRPKALRLAPEQRTGNEQLDAVIDSLLHDDADELSRRFAGVSAREGSWDFGGIYNPRTVPESEWSTRLTTAAHSLHAVVVDPPEGYRKPGPGGVPLLMTPRDFDVFLLVEEASAMAWRFSLFDGAVIDLVITPVEFSYPPASTRPNHGLQTLPAEEPPSLHVILANEDIAVAVVMNRFGVVAIDRGCGPRPPTDALGDDPRFLLPPP